MLEAHAKVRARTPGVKQKGTANDGAHQKPETSRQPAVDIKSISPLSLVVPRKKRGRVVGAPCMRIAEVRFLSTRCPVYCQQLRACYCHYIPWQWYFHAAMLSWQPPNVGLHIESGKFSQCANCDRKTCPVAVSVKLCTCCIYQLDISNFGTIPSPSPI